MGNDIQDRLERRNEQHDRIREQVEIETLGNQSHLAANDRNKAVARSHDAAKTRGDLAKVAESTRSDTPKTDKAAPSEKPAEKLTEFKIADGRDLKDLMAGRPQPKAPPAEVARTRQADIKAEVRAPRPAAENARPSGATRIAQDRAVQGRREVAIAERPRSDQLPREQAHLRPGSQKLLTTAQRQNLATRIRDYVAKFLRPSKPTAADTTKNLHASLAQKKAATAGLLLSKVGPLPKGTTTTASGSPALTSKGAAPGAKEAGTPEGSGHLFAFDGQTGDAETQARAADNRDAFYRLVEPNASPLSFNADAWNKVQKERSDPPHLRNTSTETTHDHRRVEARRGRGDRLTG